MPKKKRTDTPPLSQYWVPPDDLVEAGVGQPRVCLATTFEFEAAFFEAELLPRFLGLCTLDDQVARASRVSMSVRNL